MKKAVVLLSGGMDSAVVFAMALKSHYCYPIIIDYNQRNRREITSARYLASHYRKKTFLTEPLHAVTIDGLEFSSSALTNSTLKLPDGYAEDIPVTYVPARNSIFLSIAVGYAETVGADTVFVGFTERADGNLALDPDGPFCGYPDCDREYTLAMEQALGLGTKCGAEGLRIAIRTPIILMEKAAIVKKAIRLGVPLGHTWSCYTSEPKPCRMCSSCVLRKQAFDAINEKDPLLPP